MRATFAGLNTMVRGIMANQLSLDTTGHNITNAGTEGYSRQTVLLGTTYSELRGSLFGQVAVGTGVDAIAVERARNVYADIQYRNENPTQNYYKTLAVNYDKVETVFDDSQNLGIENALNKFYQSWVDLSTNASNAASRTQVIEHGRNLSDLLQSSTLELQDQINLQYNDVRDELNQIDDLLNELVTFNKQITAQEATGAAANDLRDQRDLVVDELSNYMNLSVTENEFGAYQINSGGVTLVNGNSRAHLVMSDGIQSSAYGIDYGVTDYNIKIAESNIAFLPENGILRARFDAIAENKSYIDKLANIANFLLATFNEQHKQGWDMEGHSKTEDDATVPDTYNFFGEGKDEYQYRYDAENKFNYLYKSSTEELLSGVQIIAELNVNSCFSEVHGERYVAAATSKQYVESSASEGSWENLEWGDRTGDGTNAVYLSELFNMSFEAMLSEDRATSIILNNKCILVNKDGEAIDDDGKVLGDDDDRVYGTAITKFSVNSYYQTAMSHLGIDAHSVDINYEAMENIMTQINNWRDSTAGVDWNEELTNMIKFQKGFASCSRCLNAMDEMLDRLVNSTGVVGR